LGSFSLGGYRGRNGILLLSRTTFLDEGGEGEGTFTQAMVLRGQFGTTCSGC